MGRISEDDLATVRTTIPIAEVISEHVALKGAATSMKGLCPFHQERTPSFNVNTVTNTFHCFGCEESGDVIDFIQKIEGEGFRWAVQYLADAYNLPVHFDTDDASKTKNTRLIEANVVAADAYGYALLHDPDAEPARNLLTSRGFDIQEAVTQFGCGYAPTSRSIAQLLSRRGFTAEEIVEAGLARQRSGQLVDYFHGRLLWTIKNSFGKPVGFGGRRVRDDDPLEAKFINTPETTVYKKSAILYGLDLARKEITRLRQAIVVEGYTDVMAMHLAGQHNVVASCGTAFTSEHMHALRRLVGQAGEIVFGFDDDTAGQKAAQEVYREHNTALRRLSALPPSNGLDPDELRQTEGDQALHSLVHQRTTLAASVIFSVLDQAPHSTPEDRVAALDSVVPYLNDVSDDLVRHEYIRRVASRLRFNVSGVTARVQPVREDTSSQSNAPDDAPPSAYGEKEILQVFAQVEEVAREHLSSWDIDLRFDKPASHQVLTLIRKGLAAPRTDGLAWPLHLRSLCATDQETQLLTSLITAPIPVTTAHAAPYVEELLQRLDQTSHQRTLDTLRQKITEASSDEERNAALKQLMAHQRQAAKGVVL